ncbi:MAG: hypothetical protein HGA85_01510 [Nanoarchaeota archaeon]|nr:hypothetical protein [Nanoarchaeota archaeon]
MIYIDTPEKLNDLKLEGDIGLDIECENNLHHYGTYVATFQISTDKADILIDALRIRDIAPIKRVLEDPARQKVMHGISFDLRILYTQYNMRLKNIFDTQIAAYLLGMPEVGLGIVLKKYFGIEKEEKFQKVDWTRRPLSPEMIEYAVKDSHYMLMLRDRMKKELQDKGRLQWAVQEFAALETTNVEYEEGGFWGLKGLTKMTESQRAILFRLYNLRDSLAKQVDRPIHFLIPNRVLVDLTLSTPSLTYWRSQRGVHPIVRAKADLFFREQEKGRKERLDMPHRDVKKMTPRQKEEMEKLLEKRDMAAAKIGIQGFLILSKDQARDAVIAGNLDMLRPWQREELQKVKG